MALRTEMLDSAEVLLHILFHRNTSTCHFHVALRRKCSRVFPENLLSYCHSLLYIVLRGGKMRFFADLRGGRGNFSFFRAV